MKTILCYGDSNVLGALYRHIANTENCEFLDASRIIPASKRDGLYLEADQHALLANAVKEKIVQIFSKGLNE